MQATDAHVLLSGALLCFHQACGPLDADDEVAGDLWVEGTAVSGLLHTQHAPDPGHHLVGRGVGGLVQVDAAVRHVFLERPLERGVAGRDGRVVAGADIELVIVLQ